MRLLGKKGGGVTLTTNPQAWQVAAGVAFQSADYPAGEVGSSNFNAHLNTDTGGILPANAYGAVLAQIWEGFGAEPIVFNFAGFGLTRWTGYQLAAFLRHVTYTAYPLGGFSLAGNELPREDLRNIMDMIVNSGLTAFPLDLTGNNSLDDEVGFVSVDVSGYDTNAIAFGEWVAFGVDGTISVFNLRSGTQSRDSSRPTGTDYDLMVQSGWDVSDIAVELVQLIMTHLSWTGTNAGAVATLSPSWQVELPSMSFGLSTALSGNISQGFSVSNLLNSLTLNSITVTLPSGVNY